MKEEQVLVIPSEKVRELIGEKEGLVYLTEDDTLNLIKEGFFVNRSEAEVNEKWRQVIPYIVMVDNGKVLLMKRTKKQSEKRLHNLYSIGVGGHINSQDAEDPEEAFRNGMKREIEEEVNVEIRDLKFSGIINDLSSAVSRVHIGILYVASVRFRGMKERELFEWKLVKPEELSEYEEGMENWSKIAMIGLKYYLMQS